MLTDYDLHLLGEGRHWRSYEKLGAQLHEVDRCAGVNFAVWAPNADAVSVTVPFPKTRWCIAATASPK